MSNLNLYDTSVPTMIRTLTSLSAIIGKAAAHANTKDVSPKEMRLAEDMLPFTFQVQTACNTAKFYLVRVGGLTFPAEEDNETTYEQLQARIAATVEKLKSAKREDFEGKESVEFEFRGRTLSGSSYLIAYALPNFFFHVVTAYGILRGRGVDIGKSDYLGV